MGTVSGAAQTRSSGTAPRYNQYPGKSGGAAERRGSGHSSVEARDSITRAERRTRGLRWLTIRPEAGGLIMSTLMARGYEGGEGTIKPSAVSADADLALKPSIAGGQGPADRPQLEAVLGKTHRTEF